MDFEPLGFLAMGLGPEEAHLAAWEATKEGIGRKDRRRRRKKKKKNEGSSSKREETGCWMKFRLMGGCIPSRAKVDTSISSATTQCGNI